MAQAVSQGSVAVESRQLSQQRAGAGEQSGVSPKDRLMRDVLSDHRFADAIRADQDGVGGVLEKVERHQRFNGGPITVFGPSPVEVAQWLEAADVSVRQPPFEAAASPLFLFPVDQRLDPASGVGGVPVREQAVEPQRFGAGLEIFMMVHLEPLSADRRIRGHGFAR